MTDPGLSDRLRQKSRRAGLAVGLTMLLTITICIAGATIIYAALVAPLSDFIPISAPAVTPPTQAAAVGVDLSDRQITQGQTAAAQSGQQVAPPTVAAPPTEPPTAPTATPKPFEPTHQISARESVNFRSGPSTSDPIIVALPPATPLRYLGEEAPAQNPDDAPGWMKFETEDGQEGWVRQIDTTPYQP